MASEIFDKENENPFAIPAFPTYLKETPFIPTAANFPIKFDGDNYPLWRRQVQGLFRGLRLLCLLDGSINLNPDFADPLMLLWCDQDALLQQAMITSFHPAVLSSIATAVTCREIWVALEDLYASASPSRILTLNERLQNARKDPDQPISAFLLGLNALRTELAKLDHPVPDPTFKLYVVNAIQEEFPEIASFLRMTTEKFCFETVHQNLVSCEESRCRQQNLSSPLTANAALRHPSGNWSAPPPNGVSAANFQHWQSSALPHAASTPGSRHPVPYHSPSGSGSGSPYGSILGPGPNLGSTCQFL